MEFNDKINLLNQYLNELDPLKTTKAKLLFKDLDKNLEPIVGKIGNTILVDNRLVDYLDINELKSLTAHEFYHFKVEQPANNFWQYFIIKYSFICFICSFSFQLPINIYIPIGISLAFLYFKIIPQSRLNSKKSRLIELQCDDFSKMKNGKDSVIILFKKLNQ